jgi:tRNA(Met) cytidine acetyltransferase
VNKSTFLQWIKALHKQLLNARHRGLVILQGNVSWTSLVSTQMLEQFSHESSIDNKLRYIAWGDDFAIKSGHNKVKNYRHHLGSENELVLFTDNDFHPDAFAALSGTLVSGGLFIWCCPEIANKSDDLFIQRLWQKAQKNDHVYILSENDSQLPKIKSTINSTTKIKKTLELRDKCKTSEQQLAVAAVEKVATGHRKRPLVLTADRGRGKSSALAIAVAKRLTANIIEPQNIIITAPHADALSIFFHQLQLCCPAGHLSNHKFTYQKHVVEFIAIDVLLRDKPMTHLLLVDEAAAIPVYLLSTLVSEYHRVVFSSTEHGYEGSGRGFAVKFKEILRNKTPCFNQFHMNEPIRWAENDPLESFVFECFLFESNQIDQTKKLKSIDHNSLSYQMITSQQLFDSEALLKQVFSVLVTAHYQTKPSDLKLLLNNPDVRLFIVTFKGNVIAVALTLLEGNVNLEEISDVSQAKRRLKNQFLPQSLFLYNHCEQAFDFRYLRIMRIAVLPNFQQQGFGLQLLQYIQRYGKSHRIDMLGTSFGANEPLLRFWTKAEYKIIRLGFLLDKASGEHSTLYMNPLTTRAKALVADIHSQFYRHFVFLLSQQYKDVSVSVIAHIIKQWPKSLLPELTPFDEQVVADFVNKKSLFDACVYSLHITLINVLSLYSEVRLRDSTTDEILIKRILQKHDNANICSDYALTGKKQLNQLIVAAIKSFLK